MGDIKKFPNSRGNQINGKCGCGYDLFHIVMSHDGYVIGLQCGNPKCGAYVENESEDLSEFIVDIDT